MKVVSRIIETVMKNNGLDLITKVKRGVKCPRLRVNHINQLLTK